MTTFTFDGHDYNIDETGIVTDSESQIGIIAEPTISDEYYYATCAITGNTVSYHQNDFESNDQALIILAQGIITSQY